jgi:hypothetical protein
MEMQRALHKMADSDRTSATPLVEATGVRDTFTQANVSARACLGALDLTRNNDAGMIMTGTPCNQIVLEVVKTGAAGLFFAWVVHDAVCVLQGDGRAEIIL